MDPSFVITGSKKPEIAMIEVANVELKPRKEKKALKSITERNTSRGFRTDLIKELRRKAFDHSLERKEKKLKDQFEYEYSEEERLRKWNNSKVEKELTRKSMKKDDGIIESIVGERNHHYISSCRAEQAIYKNEISPRRPIPKELRSVVTK